MMHTRAAQLIVMLLAQISLGAGSRREMVRVSLVTDAQAVAPGGSFWVGVQLDITPPWHVYWENPGDSGTPTVVRFSTPAGVTVGPVKYPLPKRFAQPGDIVGFGYESQVMLLAKVDVPKDWPAGQEIPIQAKVEYLRCNEEACVPGEANVAAKVSTAAQSQPGNEARVIEQWRSKLPLEPGDPAVPFKVAGDVKELVLTWGEKMPAKLQVLPAPTEGVEVAALEVVHSGGVTKIRPRLRLLGGEKKPGAALGLLVLYEDPAGQPRGVRLNTPLISAAPQP